MFTDIFSLLSSSPYFVRLHKFIYRKKKNSNFVGLETNMQIVLDTIVSNQTLYLSHIKYEIFNFNITYILSFIESVRVP